jgi:hypothetical protein
LEVDMLSDLPNDIFDIHLKQNKEDEEDEEEK